MSNGYLTAEEARKIEKSVTAALRKAFKDHPNRDRSSIADVENLNRQIRKSDCEEAISGLHRNHASGRAVTKAAAASTNASAAIAALHSDRTLASRKIQTPTLVAKLATAVATAVQKEYGSVKEARRELKKLIEKADTRPRNHVVMKRAETKNGEAVLTLRKGAAYPYELTLGGYYHSEHFDLDAAERAFVVLATGMFGGSDVA